MSDLVAAILGFAGGIIVAGLTALQAIQVARMNRRGRARLVHEDLRRLQSMVGRLYYETDKPREWGEKVWLGEPLADSEAQTDFRGTHGARATGRVIRATRPDDPSGSIHGYETALLPGEPSRL